MPHKKGGFEFSHKHVFNKIPTPSPIHHNIKWLLSNHDLYHLGGTFMSPISITCVASAPGCNFLGFSLQAGWKNSKIMMQH